MRRLVVAGAVAVLLALSGCAVPHEREVGTIDKAAASVGDVDTIIERYLEVRSAAVDLVDPRPLSTVETGSMLALDTGTFEVAAALEEKIEEPGGTLESSFIPRFDAYPLWLVAVVRDEDRGVRRLQLFERATAVDPWLLVASPEALADTTIPEVREKDGDAVTVDPDDDRGIAMSASAAADAYAKALVDPAAPEAATITEDGFVRQMRETAQTNGALDGVEFSQAWSASGDQHVLRTADGGALSFATLLRSDSYTVAGDRKVTFPADSPQGVLLKDGVQGTTGTLDYYHQVLIQLPPGKAKPRVIGQLGGVVRGGVETGASGS